MSVLGANLAALFDRRVRYAKKVNNYVLPTVHITKT